MTRAKEDIEVINFLINDKRFGKNVSVSYSEIFVPVRDRIDKRLISDIESLTAGDYYLADENKTLVIPRLKNSEQ